MNYPGPGSLTGKINKQAHISVQRYFEISLLLMLGASFLTLASTGKLDTVSIVLFSAALGIQLWGHTRVESGYRLEPRTVTQLAVAYLFFYGVDFGFLAGDRGPAERMLTATIHLILFITVVKIFSARRYRDYGYLAVLSFLMMLVSAVLTVSTVYLAGLGLYVLFAISMFISYDIKRGIERGDKAPRGPYLNPTRNRVAIENSLALTALELGVGIAGLAALLFLVIPRYHSSYLSSLAFQTQNLTGFSESVRLEEIGRIKRSSQVVMRVKIQGSPRQFQGILWRGIGLTSFTGGMWYDEDTAQTRLGPVWPEHFVLPPAAGWNHRPHRMLRYQVLLSSISTDVLFAAAQPREITGRFPALGMDETRSFHNPDHTNAPVEYTVLSDAGLPSPSQLRRAPSNDSLEIRQRYLALPPLDPRIAGLAQKITQTASNNYDRAWALQDYLRHNFGYTLDPPAIEPADPVGSFLFKSREGYCAYFAAAMTVMLRTLHIPARIVNGFQTGTYNRLGRDFVIRARDAHSWVEVHFPGYGWAPFDPTPATSTLPAGSAWDTVEDYLDAASLFWDEWVINYDFAHQVRLAQQVDRDSHSLRQGARRWLGKLRRGGAGWVYRTERNLAAHKFIVIILMLISLASTMLLHLRGGRAELRLRLQWKFGHRGASLGSHEATLSYRQFLKILRARGFKKFASQTPREFALSLSHSALGPGADEFTRLYYALRFGNASVSRERLRAMLDSISQTGRD